MRDTFCIRSLTLALSLGFSLLCFSEGLHGWLELVGEEVFPRNGSMLCAGLSGLTGLTFTEFVRVFLSPLGAHGGLALERGRLRCVGLPGDPSGAGRSEGRKGGTVSAGSRLRLLV